MFLINFNQWKCACVGINNLVILLRARYKCSHTHLTVQISVFWFEINRSCFRWSAVPFVIFRSGSKSGHNHDGMNNANYKKWLQEKFIPNLESKSVIAVDSASYHNVQLTRHPTSNARKGEMLLAGWVSMVYGTAPKWQKQSCTVLLPPGVNPTAVDKYIISCHVITYHIISYHIISYHIISYHIISYHIISYIISYHTGNNWTHCVNRKLSVIWKKCCWH